MKDVTVIFVAIIVIGGIGVNLKLFSQEHVLKQQRY